MKKLLLIIFSLTVSFHSVGQFNKKEDKKSIKEMCGCFSVTFDYAETFPRNTNYKLHDPYHAAARAEWIFVDVETEDEIVIQHILVINDSTMVKHWRQDWIWNGGSSYQFNGDRNWLYTQHDLNAKTGRWTQNVFQVDDSPRYSGTATWIHVDDRNFWECTTDAPLPRREFSKRSDYNVMERTNRHEITKSGWVHEQDNLKIIRENNQDRVIVSEKGLNVYTKIDDSQCDPAVKWWKDNSDYWRLVRDEWTRVFNRNKNISITHKVNEKMLWQSLFELNNELANTAKSDPTVVSQRIRTTLNTFIKNERASISN